MSCCRIPPECFSEGVLEAGSPGVSGPGDPACRRPCLCGSQSWRQAGSELPMAYIQGVRRHSARWSHICIPGVTVPDAQHMDDQSPFRWRPCCTGSVPPSGSAPGVRHRQGLQQAAPAARWGPSGADSLLARLCSNPGCISRRPCARPLHSGRLLPRHRRARASIQPAVVAITAASTLKRTSR